MTQCSHEDVEKITKQQALNWTINMLNHLWNFTLNTSDSTEDLRGHKLHKADDDIMAISGPIINVYFKSVCAFTNMSLQAIAGKIVAAQTVSGLSNIIWENIPDVHKLTV